ASLARSRAMRADPHRCAWASLSVGRSPGVSPPGQESVCSDAVRWRHRVNSEAVKAGDPPTAPAGRARGLALRIAGAPGPGRAGPVLAPALDGLDRGHPALPQAQPLQLPRRDRADE